MEMETVKEKENTGEVYQTPASALGTFKPGNTIPFQVVRTEDLDQLGEERADGALIPAKGIVIAHKLLVLGRGLNIEEKGNYLYVRNSAYYLWLFLTFFIVSIVLMFRLGLEMKKSAPVKQVKSQQETKIYYVTERQNESKASKDLDKILDQPLQKEEAVQKPLKKLPLNAMKVYASTDNIISEVKDDQAKAERILSEAIELRKSGSENNNRAQLDQARWRLHAILMQGKVTNFQRRRATYNLWVIYACDLKWKPAAKKIKALLTRYNSTAPKGQRFKAVCP